MATKLEIMQREYTSEEVEALRVTAELMWDEWQWDWSNPDVMVTGWDELAEETQVAFINLLGKAVRHVEALTQGSD